MTEMLTPAPSSAVPATPVAPAASAGPEPFNCAAYLVDRHLVAGDGARTAIRHPGGSMTYAEVDAEVTRIARGLAGLGVRPEERVLFCMVDGPELLCGILAAMRIGAVAVPCSTMLTGGELAKLVVDSRARTVIGSAEFRQTVLLAVASAPDVRAVVLTGEAPEPVGSAARYLSWTQMLDGGTAPEPFTTWAESPALWLYTSGTTGTPKGAMHRHADIRRVCETYGHQVLGIEPDDVVLSVAKLFFAYGIGNSLFFPFSVGACAVLEPGRPTPARIAELVAEYRVTILYAVPSFWSPLLAADLPDSALGTVRRATSAGEALPARVYHGILERYGVEICDGIGSTEALHIFVSNRPGAVVPGSSGFPVPGYRVELRRADGTVIEGHDEPGMLYVAGDSLCTGYWCRADVNRMVFDGEWMRTGDRYVRNADGSLTCLGRVDDVLKVGGMWVSPTEVESRLLEHPDLAEAVVVGVADADGLDRPVAFVVPVEGRTVDPDEVVAFCRQGLAAFKRPREVRVVEELPKTATGKIKRFRLREIAAHSHA